MTETTLRKFRCVDCGAPLPDDHHHCAGCGSCMCDECLDEQDELCEDCSTGRITDD